VRKLQIKAACIAGVTTPEVLLIHLSIVRIPPPQSHFPLCHALDFTCLHSRGNYSRGSPYASFICKESAPRFGFSPSAPDCTLLACPAGLTTPEVLLTHFTYKQQPLRTPKIAIPHSALHSPMHFPIPHLTGWHPTLICICLLRTLLSCTSPSLASPPSAPYFLKQRRHLHFLCRSFTSSTPTHIKSRESHPAPGHHYPAPSRKARATNSAPRQASPAERKGGRKHAKKERTEGGKEGRKGRKERKDQKKKGREDK
jgi:hypothetical protein